jgi:hypothetical protein
MDFGYKYNIKEIIMLSYLKKLFAIKSPAKEEPVANWPYPTATAPTAPAVATPIQDGITSVPTAVTTTTAEATVETVAKPKVAKKVATPKVPKVPKLTVVKATTEEKPAKKPRAKKQ